MNNNYIDISEKTNPKRFPSGDIVPNIALCLILLLPVSQISLESEMMENEGNENKDRLTNRHLIRNTSFEGKLSLREFLENFLSKYLANLFV